MEKMLNIVLFGPPGSGKGTQSENLIDKYSLIHLSTGDLLRTEIARGTQLGRKAREIMDKGELVSDDIVIAMIESKLDENSNSKGFIFDGFPRTSFQAIALDDLLQKKGTGISGMFALELEEEELVKRLLLRGKDSGRADDKNEDVIYRRILEYNTKTLSLKKYYHEQGKFHSIDGKGSIEDIFNLIVERINFLNAEMELTALENELEHLDLTIQDFEVANEIAPELLLEIDAIKRLEADEAKEARAKKKQNKKIFSSKFSKNKVIKKIAPKIKLAPKTKKKNKSQSVIKKQAIKKVTFAIKKNNSKKSDLKKTKDKKVVAKKVIKKKLVKKKVVEKKHSSNKKNKIKLPLKVFKKFTKVKKNNLKQVAKKAVKKRK